MDSSIDYEKMGNEELLDRIEHSAEIKEMELTKGWALLREACKRASGQAREALAEVDPNDKVLIVKYQQIAKLYGNVITSLVNSYKQEGELAFEEAKTRGIMDRFMSAVEAFKK